MDAGITDVRAFFSSLRTCRLLMPEIVSGMGPVNALLNKSSCWRAAMLPKVDGRAPVRELVLRSRYAAQRKARGWVGWLVSGGVSANYDHTLRAQPACGYHVLRLAIDVRLSGKVVASGLSWTRKN